MTAIEKVIAVARAELGYREKASNAQLDDKTANAGSGNWTKYARDLDRLTDFYNGAKNGFAWCDVFVDWCFYKAFGAEMAKKLLCQPDRSLGAGCTYSAGYYRAKGRLFYGGAQTGDQIFFGTAAESTHTGLVVKVESYRVFTIEGNTSDGVYERSYALDDARIYAYGRPDWSLVKDMDNGPIVVLPEETPALVSSVKVMLPEIYKGCEGEEVRAAQLLLIGRGYPCGPDGADGDFGGNTENSVLKYQQMHLLEDDGVIGVNTWTSLLTVK